MNHTLTSVVRPLLTRNPLLAILKDFSVVSILNIASIVASLLVTTVVASRYGLTRRTDAFFLALAVPEVITSITLSVVNRVLVPVFSELEQKNDVRSVQHLLGSLFINSGIAASAGAVILILGVPCWIKILSPGFSDPTTMALLIRLTRLLLILVPFSILSEVARAVLNARRHFAVPAASGLIQNFVILVILLAFDTTPRSILPLAWSYVLGRVIVFCVLLSRLVWEGLVTRSTWHLGHPRLVLIRDRVLIASVGSLARYSYSLVERSIATLFPAGSVSALWLSFRLVSSVMAITGNSIGTVFLPELSRAAVSRDTEKLRAVLSRGLRLVTLVTVPTVIGIIAQSELIVSALYLRGNVTREKITLVSSILVLYSPVIAFAGITQLFLYVYYSQKNVTTPAIHVALMAVVNVILDVILGRVFGVNGLALGLTLTTLLSTLRIVLLMRRDYGNLKLGLKSLAVKLVFASGVLSVALFIVRLLSQMLDALIARILLFAIAMAFGTSFYVLLLMSDSVLLRRFCSRVVRVLRQGGIQ